MESGSVDSIVETNGFTDYCTKSCRLHLEASVLKCSPRRVPYSKQCNLFILFRVVTQQLGCRISISKKGLNCKLPHLSEHLNKITTKPGLGVYPSIPPALPTTTNSGRRNTRGKYVPVSGTFYLTQYRMVRLICFKVADEHSKLLVSWFITSLS